MTEKFPHKPTELESIESDSETKSDVEKFSTKFAVQKLFYKLLSHPVILLRKANVQTQQSYHLYEKQDISTQKDKAEMEKKNISIAGQFEQVETSEVYKEINQKAEQELHNPYIISLSQILEEDSNFIGGKAYNLGKIARAGFSIPREFVVTTRAFKRWVENTGRLDTEISDQTSKAFQLLKLKNVTIRSSCTVEDLSQASSQKFIKQVLILKEMKWSMQ